MSTGLDPPRLNTLSSIFSKLKDGRAIPPTQGFLIMTRAHGVAVGVELGRTVTVFKKL